MFNTIHIDKEIIKNNTQLFTCDCGTLMDKEYQTHDLQCAMNSYYMTYDEMDNIILKLLGKPFDQFIKKYTPEQIIKINQMASHEIFMVDENSSYCDEEAYLPQNRHQQFMGQLPHCYIEICDICPKCKELFEIEIKWTDGVAIVMKRVRK
jgi:hypothetical protein